jgi:hypothetical protein
LLLPPALAEPGDTMARICRRAASVCVPTSGVADSMPAPPTRTCRWPILMPIVLRRGARARAAHATRCSMSRMHGHGFTRRLMEARSCAMGHDASTPPPNFTPNSGGCRAVNPPLTRVRCPRPWSSPVCASTWFISPPLHSAGQKHRPSHRTPRTRQPLTRNMQQLQMRSCSAAGSARAAKRVRPAAIDGFLV